MERRSNSVFHLPTASSHSSKMKTHWAYERGAQSADTTTKQIESDMFEVRNIIANYAAEPLEILHLGKSGKMCTMDRSKYFHSSRPLASEASRGIPSAT